MDAFLHPLVAGLPAAHLVAGLPVAHLIAVLLVLGSLGQGAGQLAAPLLTVAAPAFAFFQTGQSIICNFYTTIKGVAVPLALIGIVVAFIAFLARPFAPRFYAENSEAVKSVCIGVVGIAFAPTIITFLLSIAGGGATGLGNCP